MKTLFKAILMITVASVILMTTIASANATNVKDFGAIGDGVTDDSGAVLNAAVSLGSLGGTICFPPGKYLIDTALTIPSHITLKGSSSFIGATDACDYADMSAIIINSAVTISLDAGSGLDGLLLYRKGMTFPTANENLFAGTAITFGGSDCFVFNSMILGFNKLIYSTTQQRPNVRNVQGDGVNGIEISQCWDIGRINNIHLWPFSIFPHEGDYKRTGVAFKFTYGGDWNKVTDCFCWGYRHGYIINSCNSMTLLGCGADGPKEDNYSTGFMIIGSSDDTRLVGCQSAGQWNGYYVGTQNGLNTRLIGCDSWGCNDHAVIIGGGNVSITGSLLRDAGCGVTANNANSEIFIDQVKNLCNNPWNEVIIPVQFYRGTINTGNGWE